MKLNTICETLQKDIGSALAFGEDGVLGDALELEVNQTAVVAAAAEEISKAIEIPALAS